MALAHGQRWHLWPATRTGIVAVAFATISVTGLRDRSRLLVLTAALGFWLSLPYLVGSLVDFE